MAEIVGHPGRQQLARKVTGPNSGVLAFEREFAIGQFPATERRQVDLTRSSANSSSEIVKPLALALPDPERSDRTARTAGRRACARMIRARGIQSVLSP